MLSNSALMLLMFAQVILGLACLMFGMIEKRQTLALALKLVSALLFLCLVLTLTRLQ